MSHVVSIDLEVKDLGTLKSACERLGCTLELGPGEFRWYGRWMEDYSGADSAFRQGIPAERWGRADVAVIRVPGASYDIGVYAKEGGGYHVVYDAWDGGKGINKVCGDGLRKLKQAYGVEVAKKHARKEGWLIREERRADGSIRLVCQK